MLSVIYAECHIQALRAGCHYVECHYAECRYAECRYAECRGALISSNSSAMNGVTNKLAY